MKLKPWILDISLALFTSLLAYVVYSHMFINDDVGWHVEGARRLLAGGDYLVNIFDNNSPFVFGFYIPVILLSKLIPVPLYELTNIYIVLWILLSAILVYFILTKTFSLATSRFIFYTLLYILFFMPLHNFGQREIIFITLFFPYLFLHIQEIKNSQKISKWIVIPSVIMAIIAINQNILYVSIPLFLSSFLFHQKRRLPYYELFLYLGIIATSAFVVIKFPTYLKLIIPMTLCYESGFNFPFWRLIVDIQPMITIATLLLGIGYYKQWRERQVISLLSGCLLLCLTIYFFEMKAWYYHLYPAVALATLQLSFIIAEIYHQHRYILKSLCTAMLLMMVIVSATIVAGGVKYYLKPASISRLWFSYAKKHFENKKLYFFVIPLHPAYSLPIYMKTEVVSPWSNLWFVPNIIGNKTTSRFCSPKEDLNVFFAITIASLQSQKPDFIVIEDIKLSYIYLGRQFSYLQFFSRDPAFNQIFTNYHYYDSYLGFTIYQRNVPSPLGTTSLSKRYGEYSYSS